MGLTVVKQCTFMCSGGMALKGGGGIFLVGYKILLDFACFCSLTHPNCNCFNHFPGKNAKLVLLFFVIVNWVSWVLGWDGWMKTDPNRSTFFIIFLIFYNKITDLKMIVCLMKNEKLLLILLDRLSLIAFMVLHWFVYRSGRRKHMKESLRNEV